MKVTVLGNCANQTDTHEGVSLAVTSDTTNILIDTGPGVVRQLLRAKLNCRAFNHVFITHSHGDHTSGFAYFLWNIFYESLLDQPSPISVQVYSSRPLLDSLKAMVEAFYNVATFPFSINYNEIHVADITKLALPGLSVTCIPVIHTAPTFGLVVCDGSKTFAYSSDTLLSQDFATAAQNCDLMIHEAFVDSSNMDLSQRTKHATAEDAGSCARLAKARRLGLVHFFPPYEDHLDTLVREAQVECECEVFYAEELRTYVV